MLSDSNAHSEMKWGLWSHHDREWLACVTSHFNAAWRESASQDAPGQAMPPEAKIQTDTATVQSIPRIVHHIWLGSELPERFQRLRQGWIDTHLQSSSRSVWEFKLWSETEIEEFGLENKGAYERAKNWGEKSDIARYEILNRFGGIYVDVDFLSLRPLDELVDRLSFFAGLSNVGAVEINNGIIGCRAGHPIMRALIDSIKSTSASGNASKPTTAAGASALHELLSGSGGGGMGTDLLSAFAGLDTIKAALSATTQTSNDAACSTITRTGPGLFTRTVMEAAMRGGLEEGEGGLGIVFPVSYFYPISNRKSDSTGTCSEEEVQNVIDEYGGRDDVYAAHMWAKSWQHQDQGTS